MGERQRQIQAQVMFKVTVLLYLSRPCPIQSGSTCIWSHCSGPQTGYQPLESRGKHAPSHMWVLPVPVPLLSSPHLSDLQASLQASTFLPYGDQGEILGVILQRQWDTEGVRARSEGVRARSRTAGHTTAGGWGVEDKWRGGVCESVCMLRLKAPILEICVSTLGIYCPCGKIFHLSCCF